MSSLTRNKNVLFSIVTILMSFLVFELGARVYFTFKVGPSILLYGTQFHHRLIQHIPQSAIQDLEKSAEARDYLSRMTKLEWKNKRTVVMHPNEFPGYTKYFPNQKRIDFDIETGESFDVTINRRGFRGLDFADQKKPRVVRIIILGASSTFGYFNRDTETYPVYLEEMLNNKYPGDIHFEVINFGIPHLKAENIYALFLAEGVPLNPDIVTFYEGNNDTGNLDWRLQDTGVLFPLFSRAEKYSILIKYISFILYDRIKNQISPMEFQKRASFVSKKFIASVSKIHQVCKKKGIVFIVANQQRRSESFERKMNKGFTYKDNVEHVQNMLLSGDKMINRVRRLLTHAVLMNDLAEWARSNQIPFVDIISKLDQDRDVLVSWVHLSPKGNHLVAEAFYDEILKNIWKVKSAAFSE